MLVWPIYALRVGLSEPGGRMGDSVPSRDPEAATLDSASPLKNMVRVADMRVGTYFWRGMGGTLGYWVAFAASI